MAKAQTRSKRKASGGRYSKLYRKKRKYEIGGSPIYTKMEDKRVKSVRVVIINSPLPYDPTGSGSLII